MSFSSLPEELVDQICSNVMITRNSGRSDLHPKSLAQICLVSHQFLPSARRALYQKPFAEAWLERKVTWKRARAILESLNANDKALGKLVRDDEGLDYWIDESKPNWTMDGVRTAKEWYWGVLKACPHLQRVTIAYSDENDISRVFISLALPSPFATISISSTLPCPSSIRRLAFLRDFSSKPGIDFTSVFEALRQSSIPALDKILYNLVDWPVSPGSTLPIIPQFPLPLKSLSFNEDVPSFSSLFRFFPQELSTLREFDYEGRTCITGSDFLTLAKLVGPNLRKLAMEFVATEEKRRLLAYGPADDAPHLSPEAFNSYPSLTSLSLYGTHGPSLALLETLVKSSPFLTQVRLISSHWRCDHKLHSTDSDEVFPEAQVLATLLKFPCLDFIWLGYLPTYDKTRYRSLISILAEAGIEASFEVMKREGEEESDEESEEGEEDSEESSGDEAGRYGKRQG